MSTEEALIARVRRATRVEKLERIARWAVEKIGVDPAELVWWRAIEIELK